MRIEIDGMPEGYAGILEQVAVHGDKVSPRGMATREILDATIVLEQPRMSLPIGTGRKLNTAIGAAEALQLIGGVSHPELMRKIQPNFEAFQNGGILAGAYGPRIAPQLPAVVAKLNDDPDTRQAVVTIFDPAYDHQPHIKDVPCTVTLQWTIRCGRLNMHTHMRSNDVWWGLPYDIFQFTQLQLVLARALRVYVGQYYHHAVSLHMYERDMEAAAKVDVNLEKPAMWRDESREVWGFYEGLMTDDLRRGADLGLAEARELARDLLAGNEIRQPSVADAWYERKLAPYV